MSRTIIIITTATSTRWCYVDGRFGSMTMSKASWWAMDTKIRIANWCEGSEMMWN